MSRWLPDAVYADGINKRRQINFGGYNHNLHGEDGELWDMENLSGELYPLLAPRNPRYRIARLEKPNGLYAKDGLYWVDGTDFYANGAPVGTVEDGEKRFAGMGAYIIILPDKAFYNRLTGEFGSLEAEWSGEVAIQDGTYAEEGAEANTICAAGVDWGSLFRVGDAVSIAGCTAHEENNTTPIIREIDGDCLRFYENTFTISAGGDAETVTIRREVPDMDFLCGNENRLWGCKGDTIYASKLGDIFNWNVFDGLSTDSYAVDVGSAGDFTGCVSYLGYPCFFKEENIYKVYGSKPSNFQVMSSASLGTEAGSHHSFAIAGEMLFYLARTGVVSYSGGIPQSVAAPFGTERYRNGVGGSDGTRYYISMEDRAGDWHLFVYDTRSKLWHREDGLRAVGFGWNEELYFLSADGTLWLGGNPREIPEGAEREETVVSMAEFGDFVEDDPNRKGVSKLQIRAELEEGAEVKFLIRFDSIGDWEEVATLTAMTKESRYLPVIPRRCDHFRLRLEGKGSWRLWSLARESYSGSEIG